MVAADSAVGSTKLTAVSSLLGTCSGVEGNPPRPVMINSLLLPLLQAF